VLEVVPEEETEEGDAAAAAEDEFKPLKEEEATS